jgi:purine-cytosine permease-like protein
MFSTVKRYFPEYKPTRQVGFYVMLAFALLACIFLAFSIYYTVMGQSDQQQRVECEFDAQCN